MVGAVAEADDEDSEDDEQGKGGGSIAAPKMSAGHRTGLAKLPSVLEWLRHALGSGGSKGDGDDSSQAGSPAGPGDGQDAAPKFLIFAHHR